ncbi:hypothetical protein QJQ45_022796 [Haematococcus lacustris]|nr:hypothetical protein QJQ45_022796 [Haematococcus lacustris]
MRKPTRSVSCEFGSKIGITTYGAHSTACSQCVSPCVPWLETVKGAKVRCNSAATGRPLALAYGAAGFSGIGSIGSRGVPVKQMRREACKQFSGRVVLVHEFRTSRVSSARTNVVADQAESFRWLYPVRSMATRSRIRGLMCSTSNVIKRRFYDRDVAHPCFPARPPVGTASGHEATASALAASREGRQHQSQSGGSLPGPVSEVQARPRRCLSLDSALSWAGQGSASSLDGSLDAGQQPASCQDVLGSHAVQQVAAYGVGGSVEGCEGGVSQTPPPLVWHPPAPPVSHRCRLALAPQGRRSRSKGRVAALPTEAAHLDEHEHNLGAMQKQQQKCQDQRPQQLQQQQQDDHHRKKHQHPPQQKQQQHQPRGHHQQQVGRCCVAQRALPTRHAAPCRVRGTSPDSVLNTHSAFASPACQHHTAGAASASSLPLALPGAPPSSQLLDLSLLQPLSPVLSTAPQSDVLATFIAATSSICPITPAASAHTSWLDCGEERRMRHRLARAGIATYLQPAVPHADTAAAAERDSPVRARSTLFHREALLSAVGGAGAEGGVGSGGGVAAAGAASALGRHSLGAKKAGGLGAALRAAGRLLSKQLSALSAW